MPVYSDLPPTLRDIGMPPGVSIQRQEDLASMMPEIARKTLFGHTGDAFFGTAFLQGGRLQFTTAMPMQKLVDLSKVNLAVKKASLSEVEEKTNRPTEPTHKRDLKQYLFQTACNAHKFILPSVTLNLGVGMDENAPTVTLVIVGNLDDGTRFWPAVLLLPALTRLDLTDGAHRRIVLHDIIYGGGDRDGVTDEHRDNLKANCIDVKIVFEAGQAQSHQDFADCAKAKPISNSISVAFDTRNEKNARATRLVKQVPFLERYVDATASGVNLSAKSVKIWSLNAVQMFVNHICEKHPNPVASVAQKTDGVERFFAALVRHMPQLVALAPIDVARGQTGIIREANGGDIVMRGAGMGIFARAYLYCTRTSFDYEEMAKRLAKLEWTVLTTSRESLPNTTDLYASAVRQAARPHWLGMLAISEIRYKVASTSAHLDNAWQRIGRLMQLPPEVELPAAAD